MKRQKRVGQYGWIVLMVVVASSWFLYSNAIRATTVSKQVSAIQTFAVADSKGAVLSLTLGDGSSVKYLLKAETPAAHMQKSDEHAVDTLQNWQLASLGTAINVGGATVPIGIALRIAN